MKKEYDFRKGKRGAVVSVPTGKTRITIRLDDDLLDWFRDQVDKAGGGNYAPCRRCPQDQSRAGPVLETSLGSGCIGSVLSPQSTRTRSRTFCWRNQVVRFWGFFSDCPSTV